MAHQSEMIAQDIERYLKDHENKELLRFITCGSVDDGKSTLIGRLLHDSKMIFEDQLAAIEKESKKVGTQGDEIDLALLVDGLQSEREQGITIDVAYRYFSTERRKFIIADTPGHEQYTRNMVTGASNADLAIILIDARHGVQKQTRRHSYIAALLGIRNIIIAVNKMDLVEYSQECFTRIQRNVEALIPHLPNHAEITFRYLPLSALSGENVVHPGSLMPWYSGLPLMEMLDTTTLQDYRTQQSEMFRFPVQYVNRPHSNFRGYCGTIASGRVDVGDEITVLPSGKTTRIQSILLPMSPILPYRETAPQESADFAFAPMAVTLTTSDEIDIGRGDLLVHTDRLPNVSNRLDVMIVWMGEEAMVLDRSYDFKMATSVLSGRFEHIAYKVDVTTYEKLNVNELQLNDIGLLRLVLNRPVAVDTYRMNRYTGSFIVIDRISNHTVGAGMIVEAGSFDSGSLRTEGREYTPEERELNRYIRTHYPEWECKEI